MPAFPEIRMVNLEALLTDVERRTVADTEVNKGELDIRMREAGLKDLTDILGEVLTAFAIREGSGMGGTLREARMDTVLGDVKFKCYYHAPDSGKPVSRQDRRKQERIAAKTKQRRKKNGSFTRAGGAKGAFPFKNGLRLVDGMTPALAALHNRIAARAGSFREGTDTLSDFVGVIMSESTFMRRTYAAGNRALKEQELEVLRMGLSGVIPTRLALALTAVVPTLYIMLDGTGVPCIKKDTRKRKGKDGKPAKTRELKVGVIGTYRWIDSRRCPVRDPGSETHIVSAKKACMFGSLLRRVANSRGYGGGGFRIQICGDGAEWIENIVKMAFPGDDVIFTVDFFHACEHLHSFFGCVLEKGKVLNKAFRKARGILRRNGGQGLITHLGRLYSEAIKGNKDALTELNYFKKRTEHMKYAEYRKEGLYIGSGIIEAACRTDVARRCKQAGMHWRILNAAAMCALVARLRSGVPASKLAI